jgi:hypothetical protein
MGFNAVKDSLNKIIEDIIITDNNLYINFNDGLALRIWDIHSNRMTSNDDPKIFVGSELLDILMIVENINILKITLRTSKGNYNIYNDINSPPSLTSEITSAWISKS